jgi:hypothetical protein
MWSHRTTKENETRGCCCLGRQAQMIHRLLWHWDTYRRAGGWERDWRWPLFIGVATVVAWGCCGRFN